MKKELQRIKIAEVCGWKDIFVENQELVLGKHEPESMGRDYLDVPDYLNDLNAMHEAEEVLSDLQYRKYCNLLDEAGYDDRGVNYPTWSRSATASQRAEAFLKTLNLWEEQ